VSGDIARTAWVLAIAVLAALAPEVVLGLSRASGEGPGAAAAFCAMAAALAVATAAMAALLAPAVVGLAALVRAAGGPATGRRPTASGAALVHALASGSALFVVATAAVATGLVRRFRDPALLGLTIALAALAVLVAATAAALVVHAAVRRAPRLLSDRLVTSDPLRDGAAAIGLWLALGWLAVAVAWQLWAELALVFPLRLAAALTVAVLVATRGPALLAWRDTRRGARLLGARSAAIALGLAAAVLWLADHPHARRVLLESPPLAAAYRLLGWVTDVDRDGFTALLGGGDCAPFDGAIHPAARDLPDDGIDQNCSGSDYRPGPPRAVGAGARVPPALRRDDYDLLLVTIDTLRYDRTTPSGYRRDTSPRLAALAARSVWFEEAHAPANITRESLPVLAAGRHMAELPLGRQLEPAQFAPRVLDPDATTIAEQLSAAGYATAMFTAYGFFSDWNLAQGMDRFVNLAGGTYHGGAAKLTRAALAHLTALPQGQRWFTWIHYLDPHQPYDRHDGFPVFGTEYPDRYDGDIAYVDHHLGLLLDWIAADAARAARTIVVVTADHGEHLGEGGRTFHGNSLHRVLTHVPLVIHVPGMTPRRVATPASLVDLAPTLAALLDVAPSPDWTGEPLVDVLLGDRHDPDRVVFAADASRQHYVAIGGGLRLHLEARDALHRLVDPVADPLEEVDLSAARPVERARLQQALDRWREEVASRRP
jgi:choline-sulfatase